MNDQLINNLTIHIPQTISASAYMALEMWNSKVQIITEIDYFGDDLFLSHFWLRQ